MRGTFDSSQKKNILPGVFFCEVQSFSFQFQKVHNQPGLSSRVGDQRFSLEAIMNMTLLTLVGK